MKATAAVNVQLLKTADKARNNAQYHVNADARIQNQLMDVQVFRNGTKIPANANVQRVWKGNHVALEKNGMKVNADVDVHHHSLIVDQERHTKHVHAVVDVILVCLEEDVPEIKFGAMISVNVFVQETCKNQLMDVELNGGTTRSVNANVSQVVQKRDVKVFRHGQKTHVLVTAQPTDQNQLNVLKIHTGMKRVALVNANEECHVVVVLEARNGIQINANVNAHS